MYVIKHAFPDLVFFIFFAFPLSSVMSSKILLKDFMKLISSIVSSDSHHCFSPLLNNVNINKQDSLMSLQIVLIGDGLNMQIVFIH